MDDKKIAILFAEDENLKEPGDSSENIESLLAAAGAGSKGTKLGRFQKLSASFMIMTMCSGNIFF